MEGAADFPGEFSTPSRSRGGQPLHSDGLSGPALKADRLLRDVLGESQYLRMKTVGYLDLPSGKHPGRTYRLDVGGNLSFREPGENGFNTSLCVQPLDDVPRDDQVVMRYLLVIADEDRLLKVANPITFGLFSLVRALYHDFSQQHARPVAMILSVGIVGFFLAALALEIWTVARLLGPQPLLATGILVVFLIPAFIGGVLSAAGLAEVVRALLRGVRQVIRPLRR